MNDATLQSIDDIREMWKYKNIQHFLLIFMIIVWLAQYVLFTFFCNNIG